METVALRRVEQGQDHRGTDGLRLHALSDLRRTVNRKSSAVEIEPIDDLPELPLKDVLSLQAVAMGVLRENARRPRVRNKLHQFTLLQNSGSPIGSNDVDRFVSVRTGMVDFRSWKLSVSFLEYILNDKLRYSNTRELYQLEWGADGQATGTKLTIVNYNPVVDTYIHPDTQALTDQVVPSGSSWRQPLHPQAIEEIRERMLNTVGQFDIEAAA